MFDTIQSTEFLIDNRLWPGQGKSAKKTFVKNLWGLKASSLAGEFDE
jgi:hypothetical protein